MAHTPPVHERAQGYFRELQASICRGLEQADGKSAFREDLWDLAAGSGGGGATRVIAGGAVLEKGGVNFSAVRSVLSAPLAERMGVPAQEVLATGISLVLHPASPMVPTVHMNLRHLRLAGGDAWFGGGADLTPWYLFEEDARHFHATLRDACRRHACASYPDFAKGCDEYFFLKHRGETRGVGGVFFDYQRTDPEAFFAFVRDLGDAFLPAYLPILERRRGEPWGPAEKRWQLLRRGRYVEFNLVCDRGTLFGLETGGRTESILMSLPPDASWEYDHAPPAGGREAELLAALRQPRPWI